MGSVYNKSRNTTTKTQRPILTETQNNKARMPKIWLHPLFYLELITNRPVIMKRFNVNKALYRYIIACSQAASSYGPNKPLAERYYKFISTSTDKLVLREIKKNLIQ